MNKVRVNPSLTRPSAIETSKRLWLQTPLKDQLKSWIDAKPGTPELRKEWIERTRLALENALKDEVLPQPQKDELEFIAGSMGRAMQIWFSALGEKPERFRGQPQLLATNASSCLDYVHFAPDGGLEEAKIMRSLYLAGMFTKSVTTWMELTHYCLKDCLDNLRTKLPNLDELIMEFVLPTLKDGDPKVIFDMYWISRMKRNAEEVMISAFMRADSSYSADYSIDENMFMTALFYGYRHSVYYFWNLVNTNRKMRVLVQAFRPLFIFNCFTQSWEADGHVVMFALNQLSVYGLQNIKNKMMSSALTILTLLEWPYDDVFMGAIVIAVNRHISMVNQGIAPNPQDSTNYHRIIKQLFLKMWYGRNELVKYNLRFRVIFYEIWKMNPSNLKRSITAPLLSVLAKANEIELLKHILSDPELQDKRNGFVTDLRKLLQNSNVDIDFLNNFVA